MQALLSFINIAAGKKKHLNCYFTQFQVSFLKQNSKKFTSHLSVLFPQFWYTKLDDEPVTNIRQRFLKCDTIWKQQS